MSLELNQSTGEFISPHEVVLQFLQDEDIQGVEAGLSSVLAKPIPYALSHLNSSGFRGRNLQEALDEIKAKQIGVMGDAWIDYTGQPKLKANINITDPEVEDLIKTGKVLISDAFWRSTDTPHISSFDFDHLLVYPRSSKIKQGKAEALIVNQTPLEDIMTDRPIEKQITEPTSLEYANSLLVKNQEVIVEREKAILTLNQEIKEKDGIITKKDELISQKDELIKNQTAEIAAYKIAEVEAEKAEELALNQSIFASYAEGVRKAFTPRIGELDESKSAKRLLLEMNQAQAKVPPATLTKKSGEQFVTNQEDEEIAAAQARLSGTRVKVNYNVEG